MPTLLKTVSRGGGSTSLGTSCLQVVVLLEEVDQEWSSCSEVPGAFIVWPSIPSAECIPLRTGRAGRLDPNPEIVLPSSFCAGLAIVCTVRWHHDSKFQSHWARPVAASTPARWLQAKADETCTEQGKEGPKKTHGTP